MDTYRFIIICTICLCISESALAGVQIEDYELGISGQWRQNSWVPLRFVVKSLNESFEGKIVAQVEKTSTVSMPLNLSYKDLKADTLYLFLNNISPQISLNLIDSDNNLIDSESFIPEPPKRLDDLVILVITPVKDDRLDSLSYNGGLNSLRHATTAKERIWVSYVDSFRNLPRQWVGYSSVDLIIIRELPLDSIQISPNQQKALVDWLTAGGTLLIPGGTNYQYVNRGFIRSLLPVEFIELTVRSSLKSLSEKFGFNFDPSSNFDLIKARSRAMSLPAREATCGQIILEEDGIPLIVEREFGDGKVVFMAFDYSAPPFSNEPGFSNFWAWFANTLAKSEVRKEMVYEPYRRHEKKIRNLLASNLSKKTPLMRFAGVFLILYVVSVCLGNLLLKRYTRNAKTVISVNFVVILTFTAVLLLSQKFWEDDILLKNFSIMNVYPETGRARLSSYISLVGERSALHTLEFDTPLFLRGLSNTSGPSLRSGASLEFVQSDNFKFNNVNIAPWAMNAFHSQSYFDIDGTIQIEQEDETRPQAKRRNKIVISNNLPFALDDVYVIYQNRLGNIKTISEGSQATIEFKDSLDDDSIPPVFGRSSLRREFSKIIANEGILNYLNEVRSPILLGWVKRPFLKVRSGNYTISGETLVVHSILHFELED